MPDRFGSFVEAVNREARVATLSSPNLGAVTPSANLVLTSEVTVSVASTAPVPQGTRRMPIHLVETEAPSSANYLRKKVANKTPRLASLPDSSRFKFALRSGAKGSSLGADSGAYAASAPKGATKVLSRAARTKVLSSVNHLCGDEKNEASSRASLPKPADAKSAPHKVMSKKVVSKLPEQINA